MTSSPVVLSALLLATVVPAGHAQQEPDPIEAGLPATPERYADGIDVRHYDVEIGLGDDEGWFGGRVEIELTTEVPAPPAARLDFTGLAVLAVTLDGATVDDWSLENGILSVPLGASPRGGHRIGVEYRGTPDDGLILGENVHGDRTAFVDNWPNRARFWIPTVDHPSDKATVRYRVHAPEDWSVIANGRLVGQPLPTPPDAPGPADSPRRTWIWSTEVPTPTYTMVVGAGELVITEVGLAACGLAPASPRADGCVEVTTWLYPSDVATAAPSFRRAAEMVDFFADVIGPFPYEKLAHVQSATRFGGMENSSAIFYSESALARGADIEGTVSHETAHQWFGDSVTEADWSHLWLSEGFATYFGAVFFEYAEGPDALRERMASSAERYLASPDTLRPVVDDGRESLFDLLNRNSYQKGGWVLHMLRDVVGDETFFEGIRLYYERFRDATALTDDLRSVMEEVSGTELGWFFEQWLFQPGYPVLEVERSTAADGGLEVTVRQLQNGYAPRFRFPLELGLSWSGGARVERVEVTEAEQTFRLDGVSGTVEIEVDPNGKLLHRLAG